MLDSKKEFFLNDTLLSLGLRVYIETSEPLNFYGFSGSMMGIFNPSWLVGFPQV